MAAPTRRAAPVISAALPVSSPGGLIDIEAEILPGIDLRTLCGKLEHLPAIMIPSALHSILPPLSPEEGSHSRAATALIRERLSAAGGWLSFEEFLDLALYAPGLGYYSAGSAKLGASGDFVTAPEVSDLFSRCVAQQCRDVLAETGGEILEVGAGTGRVAAGVLLALPGQEAAPDPF